MLDSLKDHLKPFTNSVLSDSKSSQELGSQLAKEVPSEPLAETIAKRVKPVLPEPRLTPEERIEAEKMREDLKKALQAQVEEEMSPLVEAARQSVNNTGTSENEMLLNSNSPSKSALLITSNELNSDSRRHLQLVFLQIVAFQ